MRHKTLAGLALLAAAGATWTGCSTSENKNAGNANSSSSSAASKNAEPASATPAAAAAVVSAPQAGGAPVEATFLGIAADKQHFGYKIKVNTDKPISQVDLAVKETDDSGTVLQDTTYIWQNIVKSHQQPIEKGKTYNVDDEYLKPGVTKVECKLKRVVFADGTSWSAG